MRLTFSVLGRLLPAALLTAIMPTIAESNGSPALLVVGDSLSAGYGLEIGEAWVDLLAQRLEEEGYEYRIVNASISGDTTAGGLARLGRALEKHNPDVLVIELGGNDGLRGIPLPTIRANFESMIDMAQGAGAEVALLGVRIPGNYGPRYAEQFGDLYSALAAHYDLPLVEFFIDGVALNSELMQGDGIHPNAQAQPILLDNAWPAIRDAIERAESGNRRGESQAAAPAD